MNRYSHIFMIGTGGIGMSALARYFAHSGKVVAGYDRSPSQLTSQLQNEGIAITFDEHVSFDDPAFADKEKTLVIYTPAVKPDNAFLQYFADKGFVIKKRSEILGEITKNYKTIAVAGTHGKTSISSMIGHLLKGSAVGCNTFLGGIPKNYGTNFLFDPESEIAVTEADEFDRSFLKLHPYFTVITSADADHLDIYGDRESLLESFNEFAAQTHPEGTLLLKKNAGIDTRAMAVKNIFTYALDDINADVFAENISINGEIMHFDLVFPGGRFNNLEMQALGLMNIENAVAACFMANVAGACESEIRKGLKSFAGVQRRLDKQLISDKVVYIDDYAHHPEEIRALIRSVRAMYPGKKLTGIFQPHLYSRTRDFATGFAESLSQLDEAVLLDIYPAREKPIEGVTSALIFNDITMQDKWMLKKDELIDFLKHHEPEILLTIGAGDIDRLVKPIREMLENRFKREEQP